MDIVMNVVEIAVEGVPTKVAMNKRIFKEKKIPMTSLLSLLFTSIITFQTCSVLKMSLRCHIPKMDMNFLNNQRAPTTQPKALW